MDTSPIVPSEFGEVNFQIRWSGKDIEISLPLDATILDLKLKLFDDTNVPTERQKLLGLKGADGKLAGEEVELATLNLKPTTKVMMMGSPLVDEPEWTENDAIVDDFGKGASAALEVKDRPENLKKIEDRVKRYQFKQLNAPRAGKKLLVLDIDYTLFDHRSTVESVTELMRPYLHEFLTAVHPYYDIWIWSATSMYVALGLFSHPKVRCTFSSPTDTNRSSPGTGSN